MDALTAVVLIVPIALFCGVLLYALYRKGDVKAGVRFGHSSFFIDVRDRKHLDRPVASGEK